MSGNISEVSACSSNNSDIVSVMDDEPPPGPRHLPPRQVLRIIRIENSECETEGSSPGSGTEGPSPGSERKKEDKTRKTTSLMATLIGTPAFATGFTSPSPGSGTEGSSPGSERKKEDKTRKTISLMATLIGTAAFATGFTSPGGTIQNGNNQGSPILKNDPAFQLFIVTDSIAMVFSASTILIYLFMTFGVVPKYEKRYFIYGMAATILTILAMVFMMIAFITGTYAVLGIDGSKSIGVVTLFIGLSFFLVLGILVWKAIK